MRGLSEIVRANDDAANARRYRHAMAVAYEALQRGEADEASAAILTALLEDTNVC